MATSDELYRYIEYLQNHLVSPDTKELANDEREWFVVNREKIRQQLHEMSTKFSDEPDNPLKRLEHSISNFEPSTSYDSFHARAIFEPFVEKIIKYMHQAGIQLKANVIFANSPAVGPNAVALPSAGGHLLFAGRGTFAFCNYWAKVFIGVLVDLGAVGLALNRRVRREDVEAVLRSQDGELVLRLAGYYAVAGTLIGFGRVEQPEEHYVMRGALLAAMEVFIVGHEVYHFAAEEKYPETNGLSQTATEKDLETACDVSGLSMCVAYGAEDNNPFAFLCTGPLLFFWALKICEDARSQILGLESHESVTHPSLDERIALIPRFIAEVSHEDDREAFLETVAEANNIAMAIHSFVLNRIALLQSSN